MSRPYQCLQKCGNVLVAATGPSLESFNLDNGSYLSIWTCPLPSIDKISAKTIAGVAPSEGIAEISRDDLEHYSGSPPAKKRRLSGMKTNMEAAESPSSANQTSKNKKGKWPHDASRTRKSAPAITSLTSTQGGRHVIAVTGEDKSVRVFEHDGKGTLNQLSQRAMPKRPCAVTITADGLTIICADKFGDVYSLPLLITDTLVNLSGSMQTDVGNTSALDEPKPFVSAANHLTVHSVRNRRALQNQMRQNQKKQEKTEVSFEHDLLLGHVSMLTDLALIDLGGQSYIVTADRDEHIRISRGFPQNHIIEGFCLGHSEFISRLCLPATVPSILISGGGDDEIYSWKWLSGELIQKVNIKQHAEKVMSNVTPKVDEINHTIISPFKLPKIAVSTIRHVKAGQDKPCEFIVVSCEGIPGLFFFSFQVDQTLKHVQTITLDGNPLDIIPDSITGSIFVSVDLIHEPGSSIKRRDQPDSMLQQLQMFHVEGRKWIKGNLEFEVPHDQHSSDQASDDHVVDLASLLYKVETLRKRGGED